jgi:SOS-response transcriptional repressor LexA
MLANKFHIQPCTADKYGIKNLFAFRQFDNSMNKIIPVGAIVIGRVTHSWMSGDLVVCLIEGERTVRRVYTGDNSIRVTPETFDKYILDRFLEDESLILGKFVYCETIPIE